MRGRKDKLKEGGPGQLSTVRTLKEHLHDVLNVAGPDDHVGNAFAKFTAGLILLSTTCVILESVDDIRRAFGSLLEGLEAGTTCAFTIEYVLRVWCCPVDHRLAGPIVGRIRYMLTPLALIDLLAVLPFYLTLGAGSPFLVVRCLRLVRLMRAFKLARYSPTIRLFARVFVDKRQQLQIALFLNAIVVVMAGTLLYSLEHDAQPAQFSSIPASIWWAVITLTTVGYGDICPTTVAGKIVTVVVALFGIGLFALPAGILASGFMEQSLKNRTETAKANRCPTCGRPFEEGQ